ncbi:futalosine hydrolase [Asanoa ferruginea]|uniref:Futalosine hydrolase n=1 Tax=Asanoa ferruginea TaxID=53367 RepID=A0A3D9ZPX3_9ACTN|nr:futalosine hydrolase [Asanoa ferruginea]REF95680.1 futalosine hydrolase [Asanoa ferruginea]GIF51810.1 Futalosine hydrolase [Asanoa ferruginea]
MTLLVVTAVQPEADAVRAGLDDRLTVTAVGVGPAAAAAGTARLLALAEAGGRPYTGVVFLGIGGGFAGRVEIGGIAIATRSIAADLGAESPDGFLPIDELGFGTARVDADAGLVATLRAALPDAALGTVLTVSTVTGTAASTTKLTARFPDAVAEGMEGYGVGCAAAGLPFAEVRTISNVVGPRDRAAWRIPAALAALTKAAGALGLA